MPGHGKFTVTLQYLYVFCNFLKKKESNVREDHEKYLQGIKGFLLGFRVMSPSDRGDFWA
jgi:hypothetical protein